MSKCLGGYQLIDLKKVTLDSVPKEIDPEPWRYARELKKPVIIYNFLDNMYSIEGPLTLTACDYHGEYALAFVGVFFASGAESSLKITVNLGELDSSNKVTIKVDDLG